MVIQLLSGIMSFIMMVSLSDYLVDRNNTGRFEQHILTSECLTFLCGLFKAVEIDCTAACEAKLTEIATPSAAG